MEMFLWFYSYDKRFLCGAKLPIWMLIILWSLPIIINTLCFLQYFYFFYKKNYGADLDSCLNDYYLLNSKRIIVIESIFNALTTIASFAFICKLVRSYQKNKLRENWMINTKGGKTEGKTEDLSETILGNIFRDDYLSYHSDAMIGYTSKILFFLSLFHYAFMFIFLIKKANFCDENINIFFYRDTLYQIAPFTIIISIFVISFFIKLTFFLGSYLCPVFVRKVSMCFSSNKKYKKLNFDSPELTDQPGKEYKEI